ncbi:MAG: hypothetical protein AB7I30_12350 [Isosphaeraceae bacterium]
MRYGTTRFLAVSGLVLLLTTSPGLMGEEPRPAGGLPDDRLGVRTAPLLLLSRADVREDLGMSARQSADAEAAIADLYARAAQLRGKTGEEVLAGRKAVDEAQRAWVEAHLSAEQRDRLVQIDLQWEGPSALVSRPIVRDTLSLSAEQQAEIHRAIDRRNAARGTDASREEAESGLARAVLSTLSEAQRERWKAILGKPFTPRLTNREEAPRTATKPTPSERR